MKTVTGAKTNKGKQRERAEEGQQTEMRKISAGNGLREQTG